ncbi:unnamed protein product [Mytilus edulis]|uniref:Uncharacterized protein n=1 Tax=Mytilus edulis TaxID=6550 RepID=A0A8S3UM39_MYTED|nr:unnamed protein product [Mytilus edulis]
MGAPPCINLVGKTLKGTQLLLKVLENQQEILKRIKTIEMEVKIKKTTEKPVDIKVPNGMKNAVKIGYKEGVRRDLKWQFEGKRPNVDVPVDRSVPGDVSASHFYVNRSCIIEYSDCLNIFLVPEEKLSLTDIVKHTSDTGEARAIRIPPRRVAFV